MFGCAVVFLVAVCGQLLLLPGVKAWIIGYGPTGRGAGSEGVKPVGFFETGSDSERAQGFGKSLG